MLAFVAILLLAVVVFCVLVSMLVVAALAAFVRAVVVAGGVKSSATLVTAYESSVDGAQLATMMCRTDSMFDVAVKAGDAPVPFEI
ncbi:hypothetical protein AMAG_17726 [Allomyces macrogynus ATCC 38327]|uniref:Uncharacterized protein n=1 Tax=Allomyces macrogynus (strain ATCC 38327) TaxID=578462 RepID=A0A0L0RY63_ALLM3|nr:hypothetical protein AMAG_17726 [Allomyces macrogynus ATCC 38327]|eukprot:KNE54976.1 hypothetical protein AMAG_17726 [Allomyces macrogynus ATCC 38327]